MTATPVSRAVDALEARGCSPVAKGDGYLAKCPGHDDRVASLSISEGRDGRALLHCFAGCSFGAIVSALDLGEQELFADGGSRRNGSRPTTTPTTRPTTTTRPAPDFDPIPMFAAWSRALEAGRAELLAGKGVALEYLASRLDPEAARALLEGGHVGVAEQPGLGVCLAVPLRSLSGELLDLQFRSAGGRGFRRWPGAGEAAKARESVPMFAGERPLLEAEGVDLIVAEGLADFLALVALGVPAISLPGTSSAPAVGGALARELSALAAEGVGGPARVLVATHGDQAGDKAAAELAHALEGVVPVRRVSMPAKSSEAKDADLAGVFAARGRDAVRELLETLEPEAEPEVLDQGGTRRPQIEAREDMPAVLAESEAALLASGVELFVRSRSLVRVGTDRRRDPGVERPEGVPVIIPLAVPILREMLARSAQWIRVDESRGKPRTVPAIPPPWVAETLSARGEWPAWPDLIAVTECPTMRADGSVLSRPGYDPPTGLYLVSSGAWPPIPDRPTDAEVARALETLGEPLADFRFESEADRAAALGALLAVVCRPAIPGPVPMTAIRATTPGAGKSLLASIIAAIAVGHPPAVIVPTSNEDEQRKRILAVALAGDAMVLLDNVAGELGSASLAGALTATSYSDRILGESRKVTAPLTAVWVATGNNIHFRGDLGRRVVLCDLKVEDEYPEDRTGPEPGRTWRHGDVLGYVRDHRRELVAAALTVARAYHVAGRPKHGKPAKGSYEGWDRLVRGALVWSGAGDPLGAVERIREDGDTDLDSLRVALGAWHRRFSDVPTTVADAVRLASEDKDLLEALLTFAPGRKGVLETRALSYALRARRGRPAGGLRFEHGGRAHGGAVAWRVLSTGGAS